MSKQTRIIQLQGFLFFGTISHVEDSIRSLVNDPTFHAHPVRFVVVDFSLVAGVDLSAAEAFVRVQRLLAAKGVVLVFCGVSRAEVGKALRSVGVLEQPYVELFETLNDAMECKSWMLFVCIVVGHDADRVCDAGTENAYLRAWFRAQKKETTPVGKWARVCLVHHLTPVLPSSTPGSSEGGRRLPREPGRVTTAITAKRRRRTNDSKRYAFSLPFLSCSPLSLLP